MTSPIGPIGSVPRIAPVTPTESTTGAGGPDFASKLAEGLQTVQDMQTKSSGLATQAATGSLTDMHDYLIASAEAGLATQLTVAVRNKAVEAFQEIMRMQA